MRITNEILLKILEKLKKNKFLSKLLNLEQTFWKLEINYVHCWKYETYINKIRNFKKWENFNLLIESDPDP